MRDHWGEGLPKRRDQGAKRSPINREREWNNRRVIRLQIQKNYVYLRLQSKTGRQCVELKITGLKEKNIDDLIIARDRFLPVNIRLYVTAAPYNGFYVGSWVEI